MKRKNINQKIAMTLLLCALFAFVVLGCNQAVEGNPTEVESEVELEVESEEISEEVSEAESEEVVSEEVSKEDMNAVNFVNYSNYNDFFEYVSKLDGTNIVEYDFSKEGSSQAIISNGAYHTIKKGTWISIIPDKDVENVQANVGYIVIYEGMDEWSIDIQNSGTDLEVSFTVNYTDGTSEDFTIYVTVDESM